MNIWFNAVVSFATMALTMSSASAQATTPQTELYSYLVQRASEIPLCRTRGGSKKFCEPQRVTQSTADARAALIYMKKLDRLYSGCLANDGGSCNGQIPYAEALRKLGWCSSQGPDKFLIPRVLWARCEDKQL